MVTRILCAVVCAGLASGPARAEPCTGMLGVAAGAPAPCSGILVPPDLPDACTANTESLMSCRKRVAGLRAEHGIEIAGLTTRLARVEAARQAERAAARSLVVPDTGPDWGAFGWGVGVGALLVLVIGVPVALSR